MNMNDIEIRGRLLVLSNLNTYIENDDIGSFTYMIIGMHSTWLENMLPLPKYATSWTRESLEDKGTLTNLRHLIAFYEHALENPYYSAYSPYKRPELAYNLIAYFGKEEYLEDLHELWYEIIEKDPWFETYVKTPKLDEEWNYTNTKSVNLLETLQDIALGKIK